MSELAVRLGSATRRWAGSASGHIVDRIQRHTPGWIWQAGNGVDGNAAVEGIAAGSGAGGRNGRLHPLEEFPSFLQFFSSRYTVVLVVMALLIQRIQAVVPPGIPYRSSSKARALVRAPAIFLLTRACILVLVMMARIATEQERQSQQPPVVHGILYYSIKAFSSLASESVTEAKSGVDGRDHSDLLWSCYIAACTACASESFVRAIDHDFAAIVPINLFTFGLLLHFHSAPYRDPVVPPTTSVYLLLFLYLAEILALQLAAIPAWRIRLWITGFFTVVSRATMMYLYLNSSEKDAHNALMPAIQSLGRLLPEIFFVSCSLITITLRAAVQALTEGKINREIFGHSSSLPNRNDDFVLALIRYGSAALETTAMKGLNNELSTLGHPTATYVDLHSMDRGDDADGPSGRVLEQHPAYPLPQVAYSANPLDNEIRTIKATPSQPNDIDPMSRNASLRKEIWRFSTAFLAVCRIYIVQDLLGRRCKLERVAEGEGRVASSLRWLEIQPSRRLQGEERQKALTMIRRLIDEARAKRSGGTGFGVGNRRRSRSITPAGLLPDEDEEEDEDYRLGDDGEDNGSSSSDDSDDEDAEDAFQLVLREMTPEPSSAEELFMLIQAEDAQDLTPVLIAHLQASASTSSSSTALNTASPLTRRRYNALLRPAPSSQITSGSAADVALASTIASRRSPGYSTPAALAPKGRDAWQDDTFQTSSTCVICTSEQRCIVLWPCRCLALCNDCRAELAARGSQTGGSNLCPCCRADVQGYSRIHIP